MSRKDLIIAISLMLVFAFIPSSVAILERPFDGFGVNGFYVNRACFPLNDTDFYCALYGIYLGKDCFDTAWEILQNAGYYVNTTDKGLYYNGVKIRNMDILYSEGSEYTDSFPPEEFAKNFNEFITYINATSPIMTTRPESFYTLVTRLTLGDYDIIYLALTYLTGAPPCGGGLYKTLTRGPE